MTARALLVALLAGCAPTQVVVYIDTSLGVPCEIDQIAIDTNGDMQADRTGEIGDGPISVSLVHDSGGDYATVNVVGLKDGTAVVAGTATVKFSDGDNQTLAVMLGPECTIDAPCTFSATTEKPGTAAPTAIARTFCSAGYALSTRTTSVADPLVKDACSIAVATQTTMTLGGACQVSSNPCTSNAQCAGEAPAICMLGEVRVPDSIMSAFLPKGFKFAGAAIPGIWVGEGGYLAFTTERPNRTRAAIGLPTTLDKITTPAPGVMAFWDDLLPKTATDSVCIALDGVGTLWLTWNACFTATGCDDGDDLVFSVGLESSTDLVRIGYVTMQSTAVPLNAAGFNAVVGVREKLPANCVPESCDASTGMCTDTHQPCGYTQAFARETQPSPWPMTSFVFTPND